MCVTTIPVGGRHLLLPGLLVLLMAHGLGAQQAVRPGESVQDGVYTAAQARRGETTFRNVCSDCHSTDQFTGPDFMDSWTGGSVGRLFRLVSSTMPYDGPGSLSPGEYTDVIAYIFSLNGLPTGERDLPSDPDALSSIRIDGSTGR